MNMAIDVNVLFHDIDISFLNQLSKYNIFYRKKIIQYFNDNINEDEIKRIKNLIAFGLIIKNLSFGRNGMKILPFREKSAILYGSI